MRISPPARSIWAAPQTRSHRATLKTRTFSDSAMGALPVTSSSLLLYVNGERREISASQARRATVLSYLRDVEGLTGAKLGCGEGGCGACTVLVSRYDRRNGRLDHRAVNACLAPVATLDGAAVTTVEALGNTRDGLNPVQQALAHAHGSQCGFCTPGIVMSMYALLRQRAAEQKPVTASDVDSAFDGNLCRCTGYRPILEAYRGLAECAGGNPARAGGFESAESAKCPCEAAGDGASSGCCRDRTRSLSEESPGPSGCSRNSGFAPEGADPSSSSTIATAGDVAGRRQLLFFPPELVKRTPPELNLDGIWFRPVSLERLLQLRVEHPNARLVVGNTEVGVEVMATRADSKVICCAEVPDLCGWESDEAQGLILGSALPWTDILRVVDNVESEREKRGLGHQVSSLRAIRQQLELFAGQQVRNVAAVGGNIATASPISDINPLWIAADARFNIMDALARTTREVKARDFFLSYRKVDLSNTEVILSIRVPWNSTEWDTTWPFKVSRRRDDDIAIVSSGIRLSLSPPEPGKRTWTILNCWIGIGGMAPRTIAATAAEEALIGKEFSRASLERCIDVSAQTYSLPAEVPGGMPEYRLSLLLGFLFKAFVQAHQVVCDRLRATGCGIEAPDPIVVSASHAKALCAPGARSSSRGSQVYSVSPSPAGNAKSQLVGQPVTHRSAEIQVTGEAQYLDDVPAVSPKELHGALVLSTRPHARILSIDTAAARELHGVHDVVLARDVAGKNSIGPTPVQDEFCFATDKVTCVGQVIGLVVASSSRAALDAVPLVQVQYEDLPAIVTIEDALRAQEAGNKDVCEARHFVSVGDAVGKLDNLAKNEATVRGTVRIGSQEHFYLEPNGSLVVPHENGEFSVFSSTQAPTKTQEVVASVLGLPMHKIVCRVKRIGGGFGGKETRSVFIAAAAAVAAQKTNRPVRIVLPRDVDMVTTGTRHAFMAKYTCGFDKTGKVLAAHIELFQNMGNTYDLSIPVLDRAIHHCQNTYDIPQLYVEGYSFKTNSPTSTAFRGFGGPQGMLVAETMIEHVATAAGLPPHLVRARNLYGKPGNGHSTPVGMTFDPTPLVACWDSVLEDACFENRLEAVKAFNKRSKFFKRGIAAVPTMFGISFTFKTYNQAGALVHIYHTDGTVLISHGGVEMGQGLHTKMCQVAATELGVPLHMVHISETATDKVANTSPTAASASSDMYGMAVLNACRTLNNRLDAVRKQAEEGKQSWLEVVNAAWLDRVDLSAHGFYATPCLDTVDLSKPNAKGRPFFYYTNGAAVSEVEIDVLTGQQVVLRTDIVMDVGRPLNPALDVGQIEGGFVQGLGWCMMEEVVRGSEAAHVWLRSGTMHTRGPGAYKIPAFDDIPREFNVRVLHGLRNEKDTIHSSKAIGEPPLFLASSVFFAARQAVSAARADAGLSGWFELDSPASVERIRCLCEDDIMKRACHGASPRRPKLSL